MASPAQPKEEIAEACRKSVDFEPEPGWCIKSGGTVYRPVSAAADVKPPRNTYGPDSPDVIKDSNGYKTAGGSKAVKVQEDKKPPTSADK